MPKVSVIMPVHNSEQFLSEAISSVLEQSFTDFEFIIVDDASTDSSVAICKQFAENDDRIVILKNDTDIHCPGAPRNVGLDHAKGDYIYFIDSDDWIDPELLECAVESIEKDDSDIVEFGFYIERFDPVRSTEKTDIGFQGVITKQYIEDNICEFWYNRHYMLWMHMFRKNTVKDIRFEHIKVSEDVCFLMDVLVNANKLSYVNEAYYHYRVVKGSTYHQWNDQIFENFSIQFKHEADFLNSLSRKPTDKEFGMIICSSYIISIYELCLPWCPLTLKQKREKLEYIKNCVNVKANRKNFKRKKIKKHNSIELQVSIAYIFIKLRMEMPLIVLASAYLKLFHRNMIR